MRLVIADNLDSSFENAFDQLVLWNSYSVEGLPNAVSIPALVEKNANIYRARYLSLIYKIGEIKVGNIKLNESLALRPGFSYWWMTLFVEKSNFAKSPLITDVIRLFAFEEWATQLTQIKSIKLVSNNFELMECFSNWCQRRNIDFEWQRTLNQVESKSILRKLFDKLPHPIQAMIWLVHYIVERWPLRRIGLDRWRKSRSQSTFISYFFNLIAEKTGPVYFKSHYWTELLDTLDKDEIQSSWIHLYIKNSITPTPKSAAKLLKTFNLSQKGRQCHVFLDTFLGIKQIAGAIKDYLYVYRVGRVSKEIVSSRLSNDSLLMESFLWKLFEKDWEKSFKGVDAIKNLLILNLFEEAFSSMSKQSCGVYLQENQGWEYGMTHAWKANFHGSLIGFPHSSVRFWDLRYFFDPQSYCKSQFSLPMPDFVAVSGCAIKNAFLEGGYPAEALVEVEALRYLHLGDLNKNRLGFQDPSNILRKVLVIGDYLPSNTLHLMSLLNESASELKNIELTIKPHPACPIILEDYPDLKFNLTNRPLADILRLNHIAFTSSFTTGAMDAYFAGLKVVSVLEQKTLSLSPLREFTGVLYVNSAEELKDVLNNTPLQSDERVRIENYFHVDISLPRWRNMILGRITKL